MSYKLHTNIVGVLLYISFPLNQLDISSQSKMGHVLNVLTRFLEIVRVWMRRIRCRLYPKKKALNSKVYSFHE